MNFTLIICTYQRPEPIIRLLNSVKKQKLYPNQILVIDGSLDNKTQEILQINPFRNLEYYQVDDNSRGLTKQRNFGIQKVNKASEIVCFLDDDTILRPFYFENLLATYIKFPNALGVGGYIIGGVKWEMADNQKQVSINHFCYDGYCRKDGSRFVLRKKMRLDADKPPAYFPDFGHGRSVSFLPPSGKIYPVEQLMGGVSSFKKTILEITKFSEYFEGYGLYEDADFTLRLSKRGKLYVNTAAQLEHHHETSGRPNQYKYGKMVVRNGWYVWRVKFPNPSLKARVKWNVTSLLLTLIRLSNSVTSTSKKEAFTEACGRIVGWWSLLLNPPRIQ